MLLVTERRDTVVGFTGFMVGLTFERVFRGVVLRTVPVATGGFFACSLTGVLDASFVAPVGGFLAPNLLTLRDVGIVYRGTSFMIVSINSARSVIAFT